MAGLEIDQTEKGEKSSSFQYQSTRQGSDFVTDYMDKSPKNLTQRSLLKTTKQSYNGVEDDSDIEVVRQY